MGFYAPITVADILSGLTTDDTKWAGANIDGRANMLDFWSDPMAASVTVDTTAGTESLESLVLPSLTGPTIKAAYAMISFSNCKNIFAGANLINSAQVIQVMKAATGWLTAIELKEVDMSFTAAGDSRYTLWIGEKDISGRVAWGIATMFQWVNADASQNSLIFQGVRSGIRVIV